MTVTVHGMSRRNWILVGILGTGNLLAWGDRLVTEAVPVGFHREALTQDIRRIWDRSKLVSRPFAVSSMIPSNHLHLRAEGGRDPLYSIYLGQYPRLGVLAPEPHDPQVCYQAAGYRILKGPEDVFLEAGNRRYAMSRVEVSRTRSNGHKLELTTYYWHQLAGRMPGAATGMPGALTRARIRYLEGRSDLMWVRVELRGSGKRLDAQLRDRLLALMRSAATAMKRP